MKKKEFQNLPSTETPITAENLNEMQSNIEESCVIVSPTEPTTNEKVWIQKGKNLVNSIIHGFELVTATGETVSNEEWFTTEYIPIIEGKTYVISGISPEPIGLYWYDENKKFISRSISPAEAPKGAKYVRFNGTIAGNSDIMLEQGSTATEYEAYIDKKIWCKNDNGVFEEFVNVENTEKSMINAFRPDYTTTSTAYEKVSFTGIWNKKGNAFDIQDGYIVCNKAMTISVEGSYYWTGISSKRVGYRVLINDTNTNHSTFNKFCDNGGYYEVILDKDIYEVKAGDKISLEVRTEQGAGGLSGSRGRFIVQEL